MEDAGHKCGVVAVVDLAEKTDVVPLAATMAGFLQNRGPLGAGLAWRDEEGRIQIMKDHGTVADVLSGQRLAAAGACGPAAIAHTRYATTPDLRPEVLQPYPYGTFAIGFNGNIPAWREQHVALHGEDAPSCEGDTGLIGHRLLTAMREHARGEMADVFRSLVALDGAYNVVMLTEDGSVHAARDPHGYHPLSWARGGSLVAVASEDRALRDAWRAVLHRDPDEIHDVEPGTLFSVPAVEKRVLETRIALAVWHSCFIEDVYFANHCTHHDGIGVANARYGFGRILAGMDRDRPKTDYVVPVPESAKIAANGYADTRHLQRIDLIRRNTEIGRTFLVSTEAERRQKAAKKYDIDPDLIRCIRGRALIIVDDSLIRGTTMEVLIGKIHAAAAAADIRREEYEIHVRFASPPILSPCFYGIDFPTLEELIARRFRDGGFTPEGVLPGHVLQSIARMLDVHSIRYLPVQGVAESLRRKQHEICMACVTGQYPTTCGKRLAAEAEERFRQRNMEVGRD